MRSRLHAHRLGRASSKSICGGLAGSVDRGPGGGSVLRIANRVVGKRPLRAAVCDRSPYPDPEEDLYRTYKVAIPCHQQPDQAGHANGHFLHRTDQAFYVAIILKQGCEKHEYDPFRTW